jgi:hypothetical protein
MNLKMNHDLRTAEKALPARIGTGIKKTEAPWRENCQTKDGARMCAVVEVPS